jgi:hypothetical protein
VADAAQFAIEIAARLSGGDATSAQLDAMADQLSASGRDAGHFEDALVRVGRQLDAAREAQTEVNGRLGEAKEHYSQLQKTLNNVSKAAERAALKNGGVVPEDQAARVAKARASLNDYKQVVAGVEKQALDAANAVKRMGAQHSNLGRLQKRVNDRLGDAATKLSTFRGALGDVGGPLGEFGERLLFPVQAFVDLNEWFGVSAATATVAVVGFAALAAAVALVTAAAVAGTVAITAYAIKLADTKRAAGLAREALEAVHPELRALNGEVAELSRTTGLAGPALRGLAMQLKDAKVKASDMPAALRAVALAESALGQGQGLAYFNKALKDAKGNVDEVALATQQKLGGIVARQMLGVEAQSARLQRGVTAIFSGLEITPALQGMRTLVDLFDENSVVAKILKGVFEGIFQPIVDSAQLAAWVVEAFILGFLIGVLRLYKMLKPTIDAVSELLGIDTSGWDLETVLKAVAKAAEYVAPFLLGVVAGVALIGTALVATSLLVMAPLAGLVALIVGVGYAVVQAGIAVFSGAARIGTAIGDAVFEAVAAIKAFVSSATQLGSDLIMGLVKGITGAAGAVTGAVTGAVGGAIAAAKRQLGIASPSKVFAQLGGYTGEGYVEGVEGETSAAKRAMADLTAPPDVRAARGASTQPDASAHTGADGARAGAQNVIDLRGATLTFGGEGDAPTSIERFGEMLTRTLEGDVLQLVGALA